MRIVRADLHIHTCLSPCAELDMSPRTIVSQAVNQELDLIAVCDHNSAENAAAVIEAAKATDLVVIPRMEITSKEEVHILGIFNNLTETLRVQEQVYEHLTGENEPTTYGMQVVVQADDSVTGFNEHLLIGATDLTLERILSIIHEQHGLAIAAHIDREGFGILGQLGFIPPELKLDALEVSSQTKLSEAVSVYREYQQYPFITSSDAHTPQAIGSVTTACQMAEISFAEVAMAIGNEEGRCIIYEV
jgi:predicted metal-dependent phosphoesterase TrpH